MNKLKNLLSNINSYILSIDSLLLEKVAFIAVMIVCCVLFVVMG